MLKTFTEFFLAETRCNQFFPYFYHYFLSGLGISRIGSTAVESIARQPEAAGSIRSSMILAGALIEGVAMFAIVVCFLVLFV